jgi:hypothetical protein
MLHVMDYIDDRDTYRARAAQRAGYVSVAKHATSPARDAVQAAGEPNGKTLDAAHERDPVVGLDDHMDMVGLDGIVDDPQPSGAIRLANRVHDDQAVPPVS